LAFARTKVPSLVPAACAAILAATAALAFTASAHAGAWLLAPGEHQTEFHASGFTADSWHGAEGARFPLVGNGLYQVRSLVATTELGWKKGRSFFLSVPFSGVTRREGAARHPWGPGYNRTETGLSDLVMGIRVKLHQKTSALSVDVAWKAPLGYARDFAWRDLRGRKYTVTGTPGDSTRPAVAQYPPTLGEGQQDLMGTLNWGTPLARRGFLDVSAGYRYRFEAPADQVIARADLGLWLGSRLLLGGRYSGEIAAGDGDTPGDRVTRHLAGPIVLLRVDDRCDVFAGSFHTASAENALHVDELYAGMAFKVTKLDRLQGWLGGMPKP
jgi:hypothetical protein